MSKIPIRYHALDGLRGVCALFVCILHARLLSHLYDLDFIRNSYLFVDFFFVLSGFVICISYRDKLNNKNRLYNFAVKRLGRIWPLHMLMIVTLLLIEVTKFLILYESGVTTGSEAFSGRFSFESLISNFFLIHSLGLHDSLTWNAPSWSISVEFVTYLFFAFMLFHFRNKLKEISIVIVSLSLLILLIVNSSNMDVTFDYGIFRCFSGFFLGALICQLRPKKLNFNYKTGSFIEFIVIGWVSLFIIYCGQNKFSLLSPLVFGLTVWLFSYELGIFSRLLNTKFIQLLGKLSFTMYMIHSVILTIIWRIGFIIDKGQQTYIVSVENYHGYKTILDLGGAFSGDIFLVFYLSFVIGASALVYKFYEEPLRIKFNLFANKKF